MFQNSSFKVFAGAVSKGGQVKAINVKNGAVTYSRKDIDGLTEFAARYGAKGLAWLKAEEEGLKRADREILYGRRVKRAKRCSCS